MAGPSNSQVDTTATRAGITDAFVVSTTNREQQLVRVAGFHTYWFIGWPVL